MPGLCIFHAHKANRERCAGHILASDGSDVALHVPSSDGLRGSCHPCVRIDRRVVEFSPDIGHEQHLKSGAAPSH